MQPHQAQGAVPPRTPPRSTGRNLPTPQDRKNLKNDLEFISLGLQVSPLGEEREVGEGFR